jgi:hypothetical protein
MKNLIIAFSLFFAVGASAQAKKAVTSTKTVTKTTVAVAPQLSNLEKAQKDMAALNAFTPISAEKQAMFTELFTTKYKMMDQAGDSAERKQTVSDIIARKIEASIDAMTYEKIKSNTVLFKKLTN